MLRETDQAKARVLMRQFEKRINDEAHQLMVTFGFRTVPRRPM